MNLLIELVRRLESASLSNGRFRFRVNRRMIELCLEAFAAVTGIRYGSLEEITATSSHLHSSVFKQNSSLKFKDIHSKFLSECSRNQGQSEDALKLALLYIVYDFFLIRDHDSDDIDLKYLHLVDDVNSFINYPWGTVAYEFLMEEMRFVSLKIGSKNSGDITFNGFAAAL